MKPLEAKFKVESALLEELGERLVSSHEVALTELVKNAYDADASSCHVNITENSIVIQDDGNGMTEADFLGIWMVVGTRNKARKPYSNRYKRKVSGSKGLGRFAARFLGSHMILKTVAVENKVKRELTATFDWDAVDVIKDLEEVTVLYTVRESDPSEATGTSLAITKLRTTAEFKSPRSIYTKLLGLVNPIVGFEKPTFAVAAKKSSSETKDPGFTPYIGVAKSADLSDAVQSPAEKVLAAYVARARIEIFPTGALHVDVTWDKGLKDVYKIRTTLKALYGVDSIGTPALIDIRYFPQRSGVMTSVGLDGKAARSWLTQNSGVKIVDNGFPFKGYGEADDDWLHQSSDKAKSARSEWRSSIMKERFSIAQKSLSPRDNPMLYLPGFNQVSGLVSLATAPANIKSGMPRKARNELEDRTLTPSSDRQGFIANRGFDILSDLARFGIEIIAHFDHTLVREEEARAEAEALVTAEDDLKTAIKDIRSSKSIDPVERERLTALLRNASSSYAEADSYRKKAQDSLETMSLLGVLAGFMTHEFEKTLFSVSEATKIIKRLSKSHSELKEDLIKLERTQRYLGTYLEYSRLFTEKLSSPKLSPFFAREQIELVIDTLSPIAEKNNISFDLQAEDDIEAPAVPVAAYTGVLLNLVTNSMKSLIARSDKAERVVRIVVSNTPTTHRLTIADTGIGIPSRLRERIWEPLFSTTTRGNSPLGTGMGLGLALVKRVTTNMKGKVELMKTAPSGFATAFRLELPRT